MDNPSELTRETEPIEVEENLSSTHKDSDESTINEGPNEGTDNDSPNEDTNNDTPNEDINVDPNKDTTGVGLRLKRKLETNSASGIRAKFARFHPKPMKSSDWELEDDMKNYISQSLCEHVPDKVLNETIMEDCPVPKNINPCKKLDSFMKELMEEQKKSYSIKLESQLHTMNQRLGYILGPLCKVWEHTESEKNDILALGEDMLAGHEDQINHISEICQLVEKTVTLVAQTANSMTYFRRLNVLNALIPDSTKVKQLINNIKDKSDVEDLFGEEFETSLSQIAKSKKNSREVFKSIQGSSKDSGNSRQPFQTSSLSRGRGGRGRGFTFGGFKKNHYDNRNNNWGKPKNFVRCSSVTSGTVQQCSPACVKVVSQQFPTGSVRGEGKTFLSKLAKNYTRPRDIEYNKGLFSWISFRSRPKPKPNSPRVLQPGTSVSSERDRRTIRKRGNLQNTKQIRSLLESTIPCGQEGWGSPSSDQLEKVEQQHSSCSFQNGGFRTPEGTVAKRGLHLQNGSKGCISVSSSGQTDTEICTVSVERGTVPVSMHVLWSGTSPENIYKTPKSSHQLDEASDGPSHNIFGRYFTDRELQGRTDPGQRHFDFCTSKSRLLDQCKKISIGASECNGIFRCFDRHKNNDSISTANKSFENKKSLSNIASKESSECEGSFANNWPTVLISHSSSPCSPPVQIFTISANSKTDSSQILRRDSCTLTASNRGTELVDSESRSAKWKINPKSTTRHDTINGCLQEGLGSVLSRTKNRGTLDLNRKSEAYQCTRIDGSQISYHDFHITQTGSIYASKDGQHCSSQIHSEDGGNSQSRVNKNKQRNLGVPFAETDHDYCRVPSWYFEHRGRPGISTSTGSQRMEIRSHYISKNMCSAGRDSSVGSVCFQGVASDKKLYLLENGSIQSREGCLPENMGNRINVCISSICSNWQGFRKSITGQCSHDSHNAIVGDSSMVPKDSKNVYSKSNFTSSEKESVKGPHRELSSTVNVKVTQTSGLDCLRGRVEAKGLSPEAAELVLCSRRKSSVSNYESAWRKWAGWCSGKEINPIAATLGNIAEYLKDLYLEGLEYGTIGVHRSAISAFHSPIEGVSVGKHELISKIMTGIYHKRPPKPKNVFIWDVDQVLQFLSTLDDKTSDRNLTFKLTMLLALTAASRASEITNLDIRFLAKSPSVYVFHFNKLTKNGRQGKPPPVIELLPYEKDSNLCVCRTIDLYLERTKGWRDSSKHQLLLSFKNPHNEVTTSTVSGWLKEILKLSGIDINIYKGHSTRSASTSKAKSLGISTKNILERAHWSGKSTFQKHYYKQVEKVGFNPLLDCFKER